MPGTIWMSVLLHAASFVPGSDAGESTAFDEGAARLQVSRSLELIQKSEATWRERRSCVSCHHQMLGAVTMAVARERGFSVDEERLAAHVDSLEKPTIDDYFLGEGGINAQASNSYWMLSLASLGRRPDAMTDVVTHLVAGKQHRSGAWRSESYRPPMESSAFTITALAIRTLKVYVAAARLLENAGTASN